ncbi:hypothetical protein T08_6403 [Trichinella sp. T8]|uniref:Uncharacterized protein n=1 Tax=Trichinella murrelli TaxID=144512 RepID=A0A0V0U247_9BILA|nr:hypothetical protein T05_13142 [Trichinella murrelli]KRZ97290.1 hypothetical protein T08_6403 [Trichinella sp. T8]
MKLFSPDISDEDIEGHQGLMNMFCIVNDYLLNLLLDILIRKYIIANLHLHMIPNSSKFTSIFGAFLEQYINMCLYLVRPYFY